jgi:Restriction Enzyme Adenine Methylase Associated
VPLFEIMSSSELIGFRALRGGEELYESEIEELMWANPDELTGESLFPVARQPRLPEGGRPDIVFLDGQGRVAVVEIKRDMSRGQLAQCLEYAGWARAADLGEIAAMYHGGHDAFFSAWQEFTEAEAPMPIQQPPRLILVARDFHGRTGSALEFLLEHKLPVLLTRVALYEDAAGRRFLDVEGSHEPDLVRPGGDSVDDVTRTGGRRLRVSDLLDEGILSAGDRLIWRRPRVGEEYGATITDVGHIRLDDGRTFSSPSRAATEAARIPSYDGWYAWRTADGETLHALRERLGATIR